MTYCRFWPLAAIVTGEAALGRGCQCDNYLGACLLALSRRKSQPQHDRQRGAQAMT